MNIKRLPLVLAFLCVVFACACGHVMGPYIAPELGGKPGIKVYCASGNKCDAVDGKSIGLLGASSLELTKGRHLIEVHYNLPGISQTGPVTLEGV